MIKYVDTEVTLAEVPSEITLCISISGCTNHCPGCHSHYLWYDMGTVLTKEKLDELIENTDDISCVCLMGGDHDAETIYTLGKHIKSKGLKSAWYSGKMRPLSDEWAECFDYVKIGPYVESLGPLTSKTTNQRFYKITKINNEITFNNIVFY